ncbi:helix-turn-helix domain-containing protein [Streptomyces sp. NPDC050610]|uniref:helix-turn-helix domain-containing protein n=1 Tax=Streptomyces sp. NPDC050610 TaxID=3157097 RepID=UPI00342FD1F4
MTDPEMQRIADLDTLKAFSHPLRMKLYRALTVARTATASQLAETVDEAVSLVSYHLRKLAAHGLIEEAEPQSADGRERWWRMAAASGVSVRDKDFRDAPESVAAHSAFSRTLFRQRAEMYERYLDEQSAWPQEWRSAAFSSEFLPRLTPGELAQLNDEMHDLAKRWFERGRAAEEAGDTEGRENVALHFYGFPFRQ